MPLEKITVNNQRGEILLMAVMVFLLVSVMAVTIVETAIMEYKSCQYGLQEQQAQQAADAGVEWGMESIYLELLQPANVAGEELPSLLACSNTEIELIGDVEAPTTSIGPVILVGGIDADPGSCVYQFTSTGLFRGAQKNVTVQIIYYFSGGYSYANPNGEIIVVPRQYLNRGDLVYYSQ